MPRHSVIMPVLNGEAHIREALASALVQLAAEDEIIVIDNGSTDATREIVQAYQDTRIKLLHEPGKAPPPRAIAACAPPAGISFHSSTMTTFGRSSACPGC